MLAAMRRSMVLLALCLVACHASHPRPPLPDPLPPETLPLETLPPETLGALAYVASPGGPFPSMSDNPGPRLVLQVEIDFDHAGREALASKLLDTPGGFSRLDDATVAQVELVAPQSVWLFGDAGPCAAKLGSAYALAYNEGPRVLELGYLLEPCTEAFAPVAALDQPPPEAHWIEAETTTSEKIVGDWSTWKHDKRAAFEAIGALDWTPSEGDEQQPELHVRVREAGLTSVELGYAWHWPGPVCEESEQVEIEVGLWADERFTPLPPIDEGERFGEVDGELVGVLALAGQPIVLVGVGKLQMYLAVRTDAGFGAWTFEPTGGYHDEVTAFAGWSELENYCGP
jgi:hypothetical protein